MVRRIAVRLVAAQMAMAAAAVPVIWHRSSPPRVRAATTSTTAAPASASAAVAPLPAAVAPRPTAAAPVPATGVGVIALDVYDSTRPTVAAGRELAPSRHLPTIVRYPAVGPRGVAEGIGAHAAAGPWPLVVFAHGYDVTPDTYSHLLHAWAAAGFVVAAPVFPLQAAGGTLDESDLVNEPADITTVIRAVLTQSAGTTGPLAHLVDASRIAVAGHSDGAVAALAAAFGPGDATIGPVIAMAGAASAGAPRPDPRHPLLVVQGTDDDIDKPTNSYQVYSAAGRPRVFLELVGAGHLPPIADDTPWRPIVESVTIDFLRHYFGQDASIGALAAAGTHPGLSQIGGQA